VVIPVISSGKQYISQNKTSGNNHAMQFKTTGLHQSTKSNDFFQKAIYQWCKGWYNDDGAGARKKIAAKNMDVWRSMWIRREELPAVPFTSSTKMFLSLYIRLKVVSFFLWSTFKLLIVCLYCLCQPSSSTAMHQSFAIPALSTSTMPSAAAAALGSKPSTSGGSSSSQNIAMQSALKRLQMVKKKAQQRVLNHQQIRIPRRWSIDVQYLY